MIAAASGIIKRLPYPGEVMLTRVLWCAEYRLGLRNPDEMIVARPACGTHATLHRLPHNIAPALVVVLRRHEHPVGKSRRTDETYIKVNRE